MTGYQSDKDHMNTQNRFQKQMESKQGCVVEHTPFCMMFLATLTDAFPDCDEGVLIRYRFDVNLFNLRWLQDK